MGLVELFYGDGVAGKIKGIVKLIKAGGEAPAAATEAGPAAEPAVEEEG